MKNPRVRRWAAHLKFSPEPINPNSAVGGSTPAHGCGWMRPRIQLRGAHPGRKNCVRFHASWVFGEGTDNGPRLTPISSLDTVPR